MKKIKLLLCLMLSLSLVACANTNVVEEKELTRADINELVNTITLEELATKNDLRTVLNEYGSLTMTQSMSIYNEDQNYYSVDHYDLHLDENGKLVGAAYINLPYVIDIKSDNGFLYANSEFLNFLYVYPLANTEENVIASFSFGLEPIDVNRTLVLGDCLILECISSYEMSEDDHYTEVSEYHYDVNTLLLKEVKTHTTDQQGNLVDENTVTYEYGLINEFGNTAIEALTDQSKEHATLTVIDIAEDGSQQTRTLNVVLGADLMLLDSMGQYTYYLDEACTEVANPYQIMEGDLTVYIK